jgi:hypothetical protein
VAGPCEHGIESSGSIIGEAISFSGRTLLHVVIQEKRYCAACTIGLQ